MLSKVKAQKTRLSNYLVKELGAKRKKSKSTSSEYFEINNIKIRISDHTTKHCNEYLNIYIPFNDCDTFVVDNNFTISILKSLKEVKSFLHSLLFITNIYKGSLSEDYEQKLLSQEKEIQKLHQDLELFMIRNKELENMIDTRNKAITELAARAKAAEELALSDPKNIVSKATILNKGDFIGDTIIIDGKAYSLKLFPFSFKTKIHNIIANTKIEPL